MTISLYDYQAKAVSELRTGSILWGGVGSGKSITSLAYYYTIECGGSIEPKLKRMTHPKDLYIITTPKKRDSLDWDKEAANFGLSKHAGGVIIDSWNNIAKYKTVSGAFFIFDEQKVVGYGAWVKAFLKITKSNNWILLTATPGDTWMDYLPIFIAHGFYRNKSDFATQHIVYNTYTSYPKIDRYVGTGKLERLKKQILVKMDYRKKTIDHVINVTVSYDQDEFNKVYDDRWNPFKDRPIRGAGEACYAMRQVVNSDPSRLDAVLELFYKHRKIIVFYNFDYELNILRRLNDILDVPVAEYNGHIHEPLPNGKSWVYLAQYYSAGESWNCTQTNVVVLYSRNYSFKQTIQAMGRIDRQNTPFQDLYYYFLTTTSKIDRAIEKAFAEKKNFNESEFMKK